MGGCGQDALNAGGTPGTAAPGQNAAVIDALTANIALIAPNGEIAVTNRAWDRFAETNGAPETAGHYLHANYIEVCRKAVERGDASAAVAMDGIGAVLRGECGCFIHEYRCDAPGEHRSFLMRVTPVPDGSGAVVVAHEDITEHRRVEEALRQSEENLRLLIERSPVPMSVANRNGEVEFANDSLVKVFGYMREDIRTVEQWWAAAYPDPKYRMEAMNTWMESGGMAYTGTITPHEYRVTCRDGSVRTVEISGAHIGGKDLVIFNDITGRKRSEEAVKAYSEHLAELVAERTSELHAAQEELIRNERLATLGQFAGSVGHELRNPLGVISNAVYYLQAVLENPDDTTREYLEMIAREVRNAEKTICDLLEISRNRPPEKRLVSVQELVNEALLGQTCWENVEVHTEIAADLPAVHVDSRQMVQVIGNLVANAFQAMPDGGSLMLAARQDEGGVALNVVDTGIGMSRELMARIFEPLVSTKPRGIGLGLTLSRRLAELNGVRIEVDSAEGKGSRFCIIFPPHPR
jgi:PAS domain S-box-containing protein